MGDAYAEALRAAIAAVAREHLPQATDSGAVSGFVLSFGWVDVGAAAGEQIIFLDWDPVPAVRRLSQAVGGSTDDRPSNSAATPARPAFQHRRRTDPPAPPGSPD